MKTEFDLKKFLVENKLTGNSKLVSETQKNLDYTASQDEELINEASYHDNYDSAASKKVGQALTGIVDIFNKSADEEDREVEEMIKAAEKETGTEVTRSEKINLMKHKDWIRTFRIRQER